jgi:hypothetical protein
VTDRKRELARLEDEGWEELWTVLARLTPDEMRAPGLTDEWSVKDLLAHLGSWMAETVVVLEQIRAGTWTGFGTSTDEANAEFYETWKDEDLSTVRAELSSSRIRMLQEWDAMPEIDADAEEWFVESGHAHYAEHLKDLRAFADRVAPTDGPAAGQIPGPSGGR